MYGTIIIIIIMSIIVFFVWKKYNIKIEGYYDIAPYEFHWDMFKCFDFECLKDRTKKCYDWCANWGEPGGRENCRMRCMDYADEYATSLKFNNYTFGRILPKFKYFANFRDPIKGLDKHLYGKF